MGVRRDERGEHAGVCADMAIHEKSLIAPGDIMTTDKLVMDGVDVSGHWNTMPSRVMSAITTRTSARRYRVQWRRERAPLLAVRLVPIARSTPPLTSTRATIYLVNIGLKGTAQDKDIRRVVQPVHQHLRRTRPEGVIKCKHWLEDEGTCRNRTRPFDGSLRASARARPHRGYRSHHEFQADPTGPRRTAQERLAQRHDRAHEQSAVLREGRLGAFLARLPILGPLSMGWAMVIKPRTKARGRTGEVLRAYVDEQKALARR